MKKSKRHLKVIVLYKFIDNIFCLEEARLLQALRHPNIIACEGCCVIKNELCIVMNYAEGGTLQKLIKEQKDNYLPEKLIMYYFAQLALALRFIHSKKILHSLFLIKVYIRIHYFRRYQDSEHFNES